MVTQSPLVQGYYFLKQGSWFCMSCIVWLQWICPVHPLLTNNGPHTIGTWHCESERARDAERKGGSEGVRAQRVPAVAAHARGSVAYTLTLFAPVWLMFDACGWATLSNRCSCVLMPRCPMPSGWRVQPFETCLVPHAEAAVPSFQMEN